MLVTAAIFPALPTQQIRNISLCRLSTEHGDQGGAQHQPGPARAPPSAAPATALHAVQASLADLADLRALLHVERDAVDPVLHHQQHRNMVLLCGQLRRQLDVHDLHDNLRATHLPSILVPRQNGISVDV